MTSESPFVCPADACRTSPKYEIILVHRRDRDDGNWVGDLDKIVIGKFLGSRIKCFAKFVKYKVAESTTEELMRELKERGNLAMWEVD